VGRGAGRESEAGRSNRSSRADNTQTAGDGKGRCFVHGRTLKGPGSVSADVTARSIPGGLVQGDRVRALQHVALPGRPRPIRTGGSMRLAETKVYREGCLAAGRGMAVRPANNGAPGHRQDHPG